jgi:alpha-glucuronidase
MADFFGTALWQDCWLDYSKIPDASLAAHYAAWCRHIIADENAKTLFGAVAELVKGTKSLLDIKPRISKMPSAERSLLIGTLSGSRFIRSLLSQTDKSSLVPGGYIIRFAQKAESKLLVIAGADRSGLLYGIFHFFDSLRIGKGIETIETLSNPVHPYRMIDHWDNPDGSIERGYAGKSFYFNNGDLTKDLGRIRAYARLVASIGINAIVLNNVNVRDAGAKLITRNCLCRLRKIADVFRAYGIRLFLSVNFASPILLNGLATADPLDPLVADWWKKKAAEIYAFIPDFGGFLVKADSEHTPGPFFYNRDHRDGANLLAQALAPMGGIVIWRCFVYDCTQDWRDYSTDRARAAFDTFMPLDGKFEPNVVLQIKNGPMDFQVREPVHPLFGGMAKTNQFMELQITQEYTGQQKHVCFLPSMWKEILSFDTFAKGPGSSVENITSGSLFGRSISGIAGVANTGNDPHWTGHDLAQANLFGFGRLAWNPHLDPKIIAEEWTKLTFGNDPRVVEPIVSILLDSWKVYEMYTAPLGIGWMVNPGHHYGPNVDGYEYSRWGTYHRADSLGIGIDRSAKTGTGFAGLYRQENASVYESIETCPDELLLFFHHVPYTHKLKSGKTVIQHIYDSHFEGVERAEELKNKWLGLKGLIRDESWEAVFARFEEQMTNAREWRDVVNTYFYRKSGIPDEKGRKIY